MRIIFFLYCLIVMPNLFAQDINLPLYKGGSICELNKLFTLIFNLPENRRITDSMCTNTVTFIKFKIDTCGKIEKIEFNEHSNKELNKIFSKILLSTNGLWKPEYRNGKPVESREIILTLLYELRKGKECKVYPDNLISFYKSFVYNTYDLSTSFIPYNGINCILVPAFCISPME